MTGRNTGRAHLGLAVDANTRRILAVYLSYDPPSRASDMMLIREIVRRHGRIPQIIVVDGGRNFESVYFESLLAFFECTKKVRPPAKPRFGTVIERLFGTTNTQFIHNLQGNTQIMKLVRQVTKSVNPKYHAVWTLPKFYEYLCAYCYEIYDTLDHPALGQSPREAFIQGLEMTGERSHRLIPYSEQFKLLTLPSTPKGSAKIVPCNGIKVRYIYYWSEIFRDPQVEGTRVEIRYDPYNIGKVYAYVRGEWIECFSDYSTIFDGCSEKLLMLATKELKKRHQTHAEQFTLRASIIADFILSAEAEEVLLNQRIKDREQSYILEFINTGKNNSLSTLKEIKPNNSIQKVKNDWEQNPKRQFKTYNTF
jgi:putative transposase